MSQATESDLTALVAEMKVLRADFAKIGEILKDTARHTSGDAAGKIRESAEKGWNEAKNTTQTVLKEMEERPVTSALAIFAVGLLFGLLFARR